LITLVSIILIQISIICIIDNISTYNINHPIAAIAEQIRNKYIPTLSDDEIDRITEAKDLKLQLKLRDAPEDQWKTLRSVKKLQAVLKTFAKGTVDEVIIPAAVDEVIVPAAVDEVITPAAVDEDITPAAVDEVITPAAVAEVTGPVVEVINLAPEVQEWIITNGIPTRATYCKCRKAKDSCADDMDMVQCSNETCRNMLGEHNANWFHYRCVTFNPDVDTDYYCSDNCRVNQKKRKTR